jgi:hypothetical protein
MKSKPEPCKVPPVKPFHLQIFLEVKVQRQKQNVKQKWWQDKNWDVTSFYVVFLTSWQATNCFWRVDGYIYVVVAIVAAAPSIAVTVVGKSQTMMTCLKLYQRCCCSCFCLLLLLLLMASNWTWHFDDFINAVIMQ